MARKHDDPVASSVDDDEVDAETDAVLRVSRGERKVSELAEALGVNPSTATRAVDRLIEARLVDRRTNPRSRRRHRSA